MLSLEISHVFTVPYRPQSNMAESVKCRIIQMISSYLGLHHANWEGLLRHFTYGLRMAVRESIGKLPAELFLAENY